MVLFYIILLKSNFENMFSSKQKCEKSLYSHPLHPLKLSCKRTIELKIMQTSARLFHKLFLLFGTLRNMDLIISM